MKVIAARLWNEPAVCIGFLVSAILFYFDWKSGGITETSALQDAAPLLTGLGVRPLVTPTAKQIPPDEVDSSIVKEVE